MNEFVVSVKRRYRAGICRMKSIVFDTSKTGFHAVLRDWQIKVMQIIWKKPEGIISRITYERLNQELKGETISRASVINFLEDMRNMGVLNGREESGKGGYHWIYSPAMDEERFKGFIVDKFIASLMESFPEETKEVLRNQI
jgi:predicted transcriptional regulator